MSPQKREILKLAAIATMLIDHIGAIGYPDIAAFRLIGRLSFPLFAAFIAQGYLYTSSVKKYASRLLALAFISQIPYSIAIGLPRFNIFFELFLGLIALHCYHKKKFGALFLLVFAMLFFEPSMTLDYGLYGIGIILLFFLYFQKNISALDAFVIFLLLHFAAAFLWKYPLQIIGSFSFLLVHFIPNNFVFSVRFPKYFYYAFYPAHLLVLWSIFK